MGDVSNVGTAVEREGREGEETKAKARNHPFSAHSLSDRTAWLPCVASLPFQTQRRHTTPFAIDRSLSPIPFLPRLIHTHPHTHTHTLVAHYLARSLPFVGRRHQYWPYKCLIAHSFRGRASPPPFVPHYSSFAFASATPPLCHWQGRGSFPCIVFTNLSYNSVLVVTPYPCLHNSCRRRRSCFDHPDLTTFVRVLPLPPFSFLPLLTSTYSARS